MVAPIPDKPARPTRGEEVTLQIDRLAYGGRGVGRVDGFVVFVPDTAPGDVARVRLRKVMRAYGEAQLVEVERPSPRRTPPPCPHFGPCGGCVWQHVEYAAQAAAKEEIVRESLAHIANVRDVEIRPILAMTDPWRYRNKMEFTFHPGGVLGLHRRGAFDQVVPIETCLLQSPLANDVLGLVRVFARSSGLSAYDPRDGTGLLRQLVIREARGSGEIMVGLITTAPEVPGTRDLAARLTATVPQVASVLHGVNPGPSDGLPLASVSVLAGRPYIIEELAGLRFRIGLETFFQTNTLQAQRLAAVVENLADLRGDETVFDLYCGVGTFSLLLARHARRVYGVEIAPAAVGAARENATLNGIPNVEFTSGDVRKVLPEIHRRAGSPHLVVLDPPRAGAGGRVMRRIVATDATRILYISCNPTTLAPDLKELVAAGYAIRTVQPLDMFPHTHHIECAVSFEREAAQRSPA